MQHYEIIATLGPSSDSPDFWGALISAGASAFRLNTSHLNLENLERWIEQLSAYFTAHGDAPVYLDLQGSKWRLGLFKPFELTEGQTVTLVHGTASEQPGILPVPHADFFRAAPASSGEIVLNDAKTRLKLEGSSAGTAQARVIQGGMISPNKGITFAASDYRTEQLSEKDRAIIEMTRSLSWVRYAVSYVKDADEMRRYRDLIRPSAYLAAKLERGPAMADGSQIAQAADALWVCRGDLGAEIGLRAMAESVHAFSQQVRAIDKPVIMAGQVLEHLTGQATPTRSEVCYLYDTLALGYRGFVLSDETAIGRDPVESVRIAAMFR